jgi:hypothetical protein
MKKQPGSSLVGRAREGVWRGWRRISYVQGLGLDISLIIVGIAKGL